MHNISLFKRERSDSYFVQYTDDDGSRKQISTRCSQKSDALKFLADLKTKQKAPKVKSKSLIDFTTDFLVYANSQYRPATVGIYKFALSLLRDSVSNVPISTITPHHVDIFSNKNPRNASHPDPRSR